MLAEAIADEVAELNDGGQTVVLVDSSLTAHNFKGESAPPFYPLH